MHALRSFIDLILYPFRMLARIPSNVISSPKRMLGLPLPVRVALLLFVSLLTIAIVRWVLYWFMPSRMQGEVFFDGEFFAILLLVFIIPCTVWYTLKLWLEGEPSPYPEIDRVWKEAVKAMGVQSINPSETPIFLVLGPGDVVSATAFMSASNSKFSVHVPSGPGPLHVFANPQSIYVVCTECCCLGHLLSEGGMLAAATGGVPAAAGPAKPAYDPARTLQVGSVTSDPYAEPQLGGDSSDPVTPFSVPGAANLQPPSSGGGGGANDGIRGTMMVGMPGAEGPALQGKPSATPRLAISQSSEASALLAYLCRCIRRVRDPMCPINGVLVTTPFHLLADGTGEAVTQLQTAIKADLATIRGAARVRCSVTHIVDAMEEESGFRELVRRVGTGRAATQRFGKGFGLWNPAKVDQLDAVVKHACGAFEDWSYLLFREEDGLSKRGNRHLYGLLCRIRSNFLPRLTHLIQSSYGLDPGATALSSREPLLFSGCYFVASGQTPDRQAFLASVFRKSREEEEELEWGSEAMNEEQRMQGIVKVLSILNGMLIAAMIALLIFWKLKPT
ncbi:type VI secretion protein IcmF/TssM N-terminal domain-containing protein [Novipirellula artificiosorum]|uniref:Type VI secretion system component TssM1 N-terminal domain-containing protein n=1 Tax=Novipirellula artificiosorum TaxID=2528016 RepID=A0A5C6D871_9BACT|nr:type VI secretion protein IcmF/TssM N-terminal domain-containing protein [Novipirellula artificiosorum]TWU31941.1 hypothetical protein Poly41_58290 [Novipirellula artificiosorum]